LPVNLPKAWTGEALGGQLKGSVVNLKIDQRALKPVEGKSLDISGRH